MLADNADVHARDNEGSTPLDLAKKFGYAKIQTALEIRAQEREDFMKYTDELW